LAAQILKPKKELVFVNNNKQDSLHYNNIDSKKADAKLPKKRLFSRKKKYRVVGCPSF
jgi:hypothetical protein